MVKKNYCFILIITFMVIIFLAACKSNDMYSENDNENFLSDLNEVTADVNSVDNMSNDINYLANSGSIDSNSPPPIITLPKPKGEVWHDTTEQKKQLNNYINNMNKKIETQFNNECKNE